MNMLLRCLYLYAPHKT